MKYTLCILYHSQSGHTKKIAENIAIGAKLSDNFIVHTWDISEAEFNAENPRWEILHTCDGLIFGSPTFMGCVSAPFKSFMDETGNFWLDQKWANKIAAGFTIGSGLSGDKLHTLQTLSLFAAQHGMIWVGQGDLGSLHTKAEGPINQVGSWLGLMATSSEDKTQLVPAGDLKTAVQFGQRVGYAVKRWKDGEKS